MPERIQLRRTKGWRKPEGAVVVSRPSRWGNPFRVGGTYSSPWYCNPGWVDLANAPAICFSPFNEDGFRRDELPGLRTTVVCETREQAVAWYRATHGQRLQWTAPRELAGRDLACWCPLLDSDGNRVPCHADVLLAIANRRSAGDPT